jgi:CubicO group peptidase (beta-lactamase class C family)
MKRILFIYLFLWLLLLESITAAQAQNISPQIISRIDSVFAGWNTIQSPGAVIGVIQRGKLLYKQAYGMADIESKQKLTPEHRFWVASVAKQFTAMSVALLAESGKLSLEHDIRQYLPELPFMGDTIRIKHLIYHTSGLRDGFTLIGMGFKGEKHYTNANVMKALTCQQELNFKPGERHEYNNGGYVLLARIVERVSGETFEAFTRKYIFQPLGMTQTHFYGRIERNIPQLAQGYDVHYKGEKVNYRKGYFKGNTVGSSGLVTTLEDLYKWDQNFYHNKLGKASPELIRLITTPGKLNNGTHIPYAFGLEVEPYKGQLAITHSGADEGYKAEIVRFPEQELTIICLANTDNMYNITHKLLSIGGWLLPDSFNHINTYTPEVTLNHAELSEITGYYISQDYLAHLRVISEKNTDLHAARSLKGYQEPLQRLSPHIFVNKSTGEYSYHFTTSEDGRAEQMHYRTRADAYTLQKVQSLSSTPHELKAYTGTYYSPELNKNYHLSVRRGKLGLRIFHLIHIPFQAMEGNIFLADLMGNNSLLFNTDDRGKISGFQFSREGVHKLKFMRK